MEQENFFEKEKTPINKVDEKNINKTLWEMQLKTQEDNLAQIDKEKGKEEYIKEKEETQTKIDNLKKELANLEKGIKTEEASIKNPDRLPDLSLAILQLKSKKEEIEKNDKELATISLQLEFFKDALKKGVPLKDTEVKEKTDRLKYIQTEKQELEKEKEYIEKRLETIEEDLLK